MLQERLDHQRTALRTLQARDVYTSENAGKRPMCQNESK